MFGPRANRNKWKGRREERGGRQAISMVMAVRADLFRDAYEIMLARRDRIVVDNKEKKDAAACGGPCVAFDRCQDKVSGECVAG